MSAISVHKVFSLLVLLAFVIQPLAPVASADLSGLPRPDRSLAAPETGLYRTTVTVDSPARRARLDVLGVAVLAEGEGKAVVLADVEQLEALARLRFEPRGTDDVDALLNLTPRPPSLRGKEVTASDLPSLLRGGAGGEVRAALAGLPALTTTPTG
jgi:hypothetical protein